MKRFEVSPDSDVIRVIGPLPVSLGGLGQETKSSSASKAATAAILGVVSTSKLNAASGVLGLNASAKFTSFFPVFTAPALLVTLDGSAMIPVTSFKTNVADGAVLLTSGGILPDSVTYDFPTVSGPTSVFSNTTVQYEITNYDMAAVYTITFTGSIVSATQIGKYINVVFGNTAVYSKLIVNGGSTNIGVAASGLSSTFVASPANNATNLGAEVTVTLGSFSIVNGPDTHESTSWELATDSEFTTIVKSSYDDIVNLSTWKVTDLNANTTYYARARRKAVSSGYTAWSNAVIFATKSAFVPSSETAKLLHGDPANDDYFGYTVSLSADGNTALIGAYYKTGTYSNQGAAYIFTRSGTTWTQQAKLMQSDPAAGDYFGWSVSLSADGNTALISAYYKNGTVTQQGAAYIFTRSGTTWSQQAKLTHGDPASYDFFSYALSLSADGNTALIGAGNKAGTYTQQGVVYVFTRSGTTWTQQAKLVHSDPAASDLFGISVSLSADGNTAVIGASSKTGTYSSQGAAYVFTRSGTTWTQQAKLVHSDPAASDYFGYSVSLSADGNTAVIGAQNKNGTYTQQGAAYVFTRSGTTWTQQAKLLHGDPAMGDYFGKSVSVSADGNTALISAYYKTGTYSSQGAAYIFL